MRILALPLFLLLSAPPAEAFSWFWSKKDTKADCATLDVPLRSSCLPPLRGQTDTLWCTEYAAATALSYELCRETGSLREISAAALALRYNELVERTSNFRSGGHLIDSSLSASNKKGYCLEKDIPSYAKGGLWSSFQDTLEKLKAAGDECAECGKTAAPGESPIIPLPNMQPRGYSPLYAIADKNCRTKIEEKFEAIPCPMKEDRRTAKDRIAFIDEQLKERPVFVAGASFGRPGDPPWNGVHALTVVGREFNEKDGRCEYVIRDSNAESGEGALIRLSRKTLTEVLDHLIHQCYVVKRKR